ncbi:DUF3152 domain-containing protein [Streptomyces hesseae]|uniref:DUF3152 domain-containing protein n=1 Tax=Streptomyces hesseae TaxID=3075519 RepID=A0ABU2SWN2_9ACTN|nr:DUF3152 domain-containing protein [Streptomyces sp. DSM 40473]MDT0453351.1 DUF3152 domain-containing protein [Streptomyces sp. DSM 40473]
MGKHSARADRPPHGAAAGAAPGSARRRTEGGPGPGASLPDAGQPVPGPGPGRRRGTASGREAEELAADFDAGFGHDYDAGYHAGYSSGFTPGAAAEPREPVLGWGVIGAQRAQGAAGPAAPPAGPTRFTTGYVPADALHGDPPPGSSAEPAPPVAPAPPRPRRGSGRAAARGAGGRGGGVGRTVTGVAAAVVTAVLAVTVTAQLRDGGDDAARARAADVGKRMDPDTASRSDSRPTPKGGAEVPATYEQKMAKKYPLEADAGASGEFVAVAGHDKAPGKGDVLRYRVDVEKGLPFDGSLFATAVHRTLNDDRSWGHGGKRTFERVSSGDADFVVTLASPKTTAAWCAKSGLDTTEDNVSCDSAATDRVMINAYRWAQGSQTFGDRMHEYRQMLINHEVGHRLGHDHESCAKEGALAPVMMQQTKFLTTDGKTCRPNAWPFPGSGS